MRRFAVVVALFVIFLILLFGLGIRALLHDNAQANAPSVDVNKVNTR